MIPDFPTFKKIELSDKEEVERFTLQFAPHSDFSFNSLWAWDVDNQRMISQLNGNLIVRFTDYLTGEPFLSFLGTNDAHRTAITLLEYAEINHLPVSLQMVMEDTVRALSLDELHIIEDPDNFDYVLESSIGDFPKRRDAKRFLRDHPEVCISTLDLSDRSMVEKIRFLLKSTTYEDSPHGEIEATERFLGVANYLKHFALGVFIKDQLIAYYIGEYARFPYTIGLFWRADRTVGAGVYSYLMQQVMLFIREGGYSLINIEQDMGVDGLRRWKKSLAPKYLKKFNVCIKKVELDINRNAHTPSLGLMLPNV